MKKCFTAETQSARRNSIFRARLCDQDYCLKLQRVLSSLRSSEHSQNFSTDPQASIQQYSLGQCSRGKESAASRFLQEERTLLQQLAPRGLVDALITTFRNLAFVAIPKFLRNVARWHQCCPSLPTQGRQDRSAGLAMAPGEAQAEKELHAAIQPDPQISVLKPAMSSDHPAGDLL